MIQIFQNKHIDTVKMKEIEKWYIKKMTSIIISKLKKQSNYKNIIKSYISLGILSIKKLIVMKYEELNTIKDVIYTSLNVELYDPYAKNTKEKFFVKCYEDFRKKYACELCEKLEISVCPYCNRNFINTYNNTKTSAQFDHFFSKSTYPIFAICLYNLIPCCYDCNHTKGNKNFNISPYDESCTSDELSTFTYRYKSLNDIEILIKKAINFDNEKKKKADGKEKDNLQLNLQAKYQIHNGYVKEIIEKTKMYPISYFHSSVCQNLGMTKEEFYLGNFLSENNYYKRPLSKLTHDINKEIKDITKNKD